MEEIKFHAEYDGEKVCKMIEKNGISYLQFIPYLQYPFLIHGFSTRLGGVSKNEFSSMNLSYSRGDDCKSVDTNYDRICNALDINREQLVFSDQIHETRLAYADGQTKKYENTDGLITDKKECVLTTSYADCVPLFFVDCVKQVIGLTHSGWRGTVGQIGKKTVEYMVERFETKPEDLIVVIGPSICKDCYEVSEDVANAFYSLDMGEESKKVTIPKGNKKYQLDLWRANQWILETAGVPQKNIHVAGVCTCCNPELLFSHRASEGKRGNLNGFLGLR